jgi:hypothetical protein
MRPVDWLYRAMNVPVRALLESPLHRLASRHLVLLRYRGRKSGQTFTIPLSYVREGDQVRLLSSHRTRWWKNFLGDGAEVELRIEGVTVFGRAQSIVEDGPRLRDGVRQFLTRLPRDAVVYGIGLDANRRPKERDIETLAGRVVLVEIQLDTALA